MHGSWDNYADHHAPLFKRPFDQWSTRHLNCDDAMSYWIRKGAPASKLIMGIPFYGRSFTLSYAQNSDPRSTIRGGGKKGVYTEEKGFLAYYEVCSLIREGGWQQTTDPAGSPYMYKGDQWIGYDDVHFVTQKMQYIRTKNLGGAMIWAIDLDDFQGVCGQKWPLLNAINQGLGRTVVTTQETTPETEAVVVEATTVEQEQEQTTQTEPETTPTTTTPTTTTTTTTTPTTTALPITIATITEDNNSVDVAQQDSMPIEFKCESDGYFRDPYDCGRFYRCVWGIKHSFVCPAGLMFDTNFFVCNWPFLVNCQAKSSKKT